MRDGSTCFGLFVDFPGKVYYDIGYTRHDLFAFQTETPDYDLYLLSGGNENAICKEFRTLIGRSYIPPKWAFGLAQSRWGYKTEEDVREVARQYKEHDLPLDMILSLIHIFTVTMKEVDELVACGVDILAVQGTGALRPDGSTSAEFIRAIKAKYPDQLVMADCDNFENAMACAEAGADFVGTTMRGYTPETQGLSLIHILP